MKAYIISTSTDRFRSLSDNYIVLAPSQEPSLHGSVTQRKQGQHSHSELHQYEQSQSDFSISFIQLSIFNK